jgi:hypothetical protein
MKWFRTHVKLGSRLALFALVLQFALAFGHSHGFSAQAAAPASVAAVGFNADSGSDPRDTDATSSASPAGQHNDQQPADACAICAVMALAGAGLVAPPPILLLPQALDFLYLATDAEFLHLRFVGAAFQARAPPTS